MVKMGLFTKTESQILSEALTKITNSTTISATSPGSVARAFTEVIAKELGNFYSVLDFNLNQVNITTAAGNSLDLIGSLYNVKRKTITNLTTIDRAVGAFYFYINTPYNQDIVIPTGTRVYTADTTYVGQQFTYATTDRFVIPAGRTKVYASIVPQFNNSTYTAGANTIVVIGSTFQQPVATTVLCTNAKPIQAQVGQETDDSYRYRIQQAVRTAAGGTTTAVRLAGINVPGVRDITIRDSVYGLGSYECLVTPEDFTQSQVVLRLATTAMDAVRPVGVRMYTRMPQYMPVDVTCSIVLNTRTPSIVTSIKNAAQIAIIQFLNQPLVGSNLVYNQLVSSILDSSPSILDVTINNLQVNGIQVLFQNYTPATDQQLTPGMVTVNTVTA